MREQGFISVFVLCMILLLQIFSLAFMGMMQREEKILTIFGDGVQAQALAEEGAQKAYFCLVEREDVQITLKSKGDQAIGLVQAEDAEVGGTYAGDALYDTAKQEYLVMGTGIFRKQKGQIFLHVVADEHGALQIDRWER